MRTQRIVEHYGRPTINSKPYCPTVGESEGIQIAADEIGVKWTDWKLEPRRVEQDARATINSKACSQTLDEP